MIDSWIFIDDDDDDDDNLGMFIIYVKSTLIFIIIRTQCVVFDAG